MPHDMKIQVLSGARMGSTYFYNTIRSYQTRGDTVDPYDNNIPFNSEYSISEPFNPDPGCYRRLGRHATPDDFELFIDHMISSSNVMVKNHYQNLTDLHETSPYLLSKFKSVDWYTLCLIRKNLWETSLSLAIAVTTKEWISYNDHQLTIDPEFFEGCIHSRWRESLRLINNPLKIPYHEIHFYEDLYQWPRMDFFNLDMCEAKHWKELPPKRPVIQRAPDKRQIIMNYDELIHVMECARSNLVDGETYVNEDFHIEVDKARIDNYQTK